MSEFRYIVTQWEERGLASGLPSATGKPVERVRRAWKELCVAASGHGPHITAVNKWHFRRGVPV